jgi:hypothetical protein
MPALKRDLALDSPVPPPAPISRSPFSAPDNDSGGVWSPVQPSADDASAQMPGYEHLSFFALDAGAASIGESPRSSYHRTHPVHKRERSSFASLLSFAVNRHFHPDDSHHAQKHVSPKPDSLLLPPHIPRPRAKSSPQEPSTQTRGLVQLPPFLSPSCTTPKLPAQVSPQSTPLRVQPLDNFRHPYALVRSTHPTSPVLSPVSPVSNQQRLLNEHPPRQLKTTVSTPNLRKPANLAPIRVKKPLNIAAETWCDAVVFPRPRLRAHILSITPPDTPLSPYSFSDTSSNHRASGLPDPLMKAIKEGERREQERQHWNHIATRSFQNALSRSLTRTRLVDKTHFAENEEHHTKVRKGIGLLAESAFSQGNTSRAASNPSTASHSRNTSVGVTNSSKVNHVDATSRPIRFQQPLSATTPAPGPRDRSDGADDSGSKAPEMGQSGRIHEVHSQDVETPFNVGIALGTPDSQAISLMPHPYASPLLSMFPHRSPSPPFTPSREKIISPMLAAPRQRLPIGPLPSTPGAEHVLGYADTIPVIVPQRDKSLARHAYAPRKFDRQDDALLSVEEALKGALARSDIGERESQSPTMVDSVTSIQGRHFVAPAVSSAPASSSRSDMMRLERNPSAKRLSTISDLGTPSTEETETASAVPATNLPSNPKTSSMVTSTTDSSPSSDAGPRVLRDTDDPAIYANLFYRGRTESPTPASHEFTAPKSVDSHPTRNATEESDFEDESGESMLARGASLNFSRRIINFPVDSEIDHHVPVPMATREDALADQQGPSEFPEDISSSASSFKATDGTSLRAFKLP